MKPGCVSFVCAPHTLKHSVPGVRNKLFAPILAAAVLLVLAPSLVFAVPMIYQVGTNSSVTLNSAEPGLILTYNILATTPFSFTLNDNGVQDFDETGIDEISFDFFKIWVTEATIDPDDFQHRNIAAALDLTTLGAPVIAGSAASGNGTFFSTGPAVPPAPNRVRWQGNLLWDDPAPTFVASDRTFTIDLSNAFFNELEGQSPCRSDNRRGRERRSGGQGNGQTG
jgi:hypothetical protein